MTVANHKDTDSAAIQSKLEAITYCWRKARENQCEQVCIGFGFTFDWMKTEGGESFFSQSFCVVHIQMKSALSCDKRKW